MNEDKFGSETIQRALMREMKKSNLNASQLSNKLVLQITNKSDNLKSQT